MQHLCGLVLMHRHARLTDRQWDRIRPLLPSGAGRRGRPWADRRRIIEAVVYRCRTGIPWRDLPAGFGAWKTVGPPPPLGRRRDLGPRARRLAGQRGRRWADRLAGGGGSHHHAGPPARHQYPPPRGVPSRSHGQGLDAHREPAGHAIGRSRGGLTTKVHHAVDGQGGDRWPSS